jgi:RHS repeat-associated protein
MGALSLLLFTSLLSPFVQASIVPGIGPAIAFAALSSGKPSGKNTFHPQPDLGGNRPPVGWNTLHTPSPTPSHPAQVSPITRPQGATAAPADLALDPTRGSHLLTSDGRLDVTVPAGAVTRAQIGQAGGPVRLHVNEVAGPSGGTNSGQVTLGTYKFELLGPHGAVAGGLDKPVTVALHYAPWRGAGFNLADTLLILNGDAPTSALVGPDGKLPSGLKASYVRPSVDSAHQTLTAVFNVQPHGSSSSSVGTWMTDSPEAQWIKPSDTSVDLSAGSLTYSYPLEVPPGPGGLTPPLQLGYTSGAVDENHNPQAPAGWVGEGWDLSLGSISWSEENVYSSCTLATCSTTNCPNLNCAVFQNVWNFSDLFGNTGDLLPQDTNVSTWYDDTSNAQPPTTGAVARVWHLTPESHIKVVSFTNPNASTADFPASGYPVMPPSFRAWLPNGIMEEFGCTRDSLQYYVDETTPSPNYSSNSKNLIYRWDLDMIVDPSGNQIHISYNQTRALCPFTDWNTDFPIEAVPSQITYDSPTCHSTSAMCTGSSWAPLVAINFLSSNAVGRFYPSGQGCPTWAGGPKFPSAAAGNPPLTMRCDDVHELNWQSTNPQDAAPTMQTLSVLNDIQVLVHANSMWNTLRDYQLSYQQTASTTIPYDPNTGLQESVAGALLLTRIQQFGTDGTSALPPLTMSYTPETETYLDGQYTPTPASNSSCGPAWNAAPQCKLWAQTYNSYYLATLDNGRGWHETYSWDNSRNNTHGVNSGMTKEDPLACTHASAGQQATSPCSLADDENWSRIILTQRQASVLCVAANGLGCGSAGGSTALTSTWSYQYSLTDLQALECPSCTVGMYWGNMEDPDKLDFYNAKFMGFYQVTVTDPDGSRQSYVYYTTLGYGVWWGTPGQIATSPSCTATYPSTACYSSPWTAPANALHGRLQNEQDYAVGGWPPIHVLADNYTVACPPNGVTPSPDAHFTGQLTAELDQIGNPIVDCEIMPAIDDDFNEDPPPPGTQQSVTPEKKTTITYGYDGNGHLTQQSSSAWISEPTAPQTIVSRTQFLWDDAVTITPTSASGTYLAQIPGLQTTEDGSGSVKACTYMLYDGMTNSGSAYPLGSQSGLSRAQVTRVDRYAAACTGTLSGQVSLSRIYDGNGALLALDDSDALAGIAGHTNAAGCTFNSVVYSACASYESLYQSHVVQVLNALNQATTLAYTGPSGSAAGNGFGQWMTGKADANGQADTYTYDALGRLTSTALPGETALWTTQDAYPVTCPATGASTPCVALAVTQRLDSSGTTVTSATYSDGWGRPVETVSPAPNIRQGTGTDCQFDVQYTLYDPTGRTLFSSVPYLAIGSCTSGTPPYFAPDTAQAGTSYTYDGLGRTTSVTDPLGKRTTFTYTIDRTQGANVTDTSSWYLATTTTDPKGHQSVQLSDAFGQPRYSESFSGTGNPYALYATTASAYDYLGDVTSVTGPNAGAAGLSTTAQTTSTYDLLGRTTSLADADLGTWNYSYDPNGNLLQSTDSRGAAGTVYMTYDGLNRPLWRNTTNGPTGAYATYSYDSTANGNFGVGRLTGETFNQGASLGVGSYATTYDARGQATSLTTVLDGTSYPFAFAYNDAGMSTGTTYSDGEVASPNYTLQGWLSGLFTTPSGGTTAPLFTNLAYQGIGGAAMQPTYANVGTTPVYFSADYNNDLETTDLRLTRQASGRGTSTAVLFDQQRTFDAAGNVASIATTLPAGTDNQAFCYDEQDRLTWASSQSGAVPCGGTLTAGTLTGGTAPYTQSFTYDALDRITSGPQGSFSYGPGLQAPTNPAPLHGVVTLGSAIYAYDAAGDRSAPGTTTSATYDAERRLLSWSTSGGTTTGKEAYDGEGHRVAHQTTTSGVTTTTYYLGNLEEVTGGTLTKYFGGGSGLPLVVKVGSTLSYLATDGLGSVSAALDSSGNVIAQQLYAPYGTSRFTSGSLPTSRGFTGQRADAASGLDYYGARYYDAAVNQFTSADTAIDGLNRFAYVGDNPESRIDPSGLDWWNTALSVGGTILDATTGIPSMIHDVQTLTDDKASGQAKVLASLDLVLNVSMDIGMVTGVGELARGGMFGAKIAAKLGADELEHVVSDGLDHGASDFGGHAASDAGEHGGSHAGTTAAGDVSGSAATHGAGDAGDHAAAAGGGEGGCSFAASTPVATPQGEQPIGRLQVGDQVTAYNPTTGKSEAETVEHVWLNHDHDLLDVQLQTRDVSSAPVNTSTGSVQGSSRLQIVKQGVKAALAGVAAALALAMGGHTPALAAPAAPAQTSATTTSTHTEIVHTTANHPWLTADHGWVPAGLLRPGEPVVTLDQSGSARATRTTTVAWVHVVPGRADMYNLTVDHDHTYSVGPSWYIVHNVCFDGKTGNTPETDAGKAFHYDRFNGGKADNYGGPSQLRDIYPNTEFKFTPLFEEGPDVEFVGGQHPSTYGRGNWPAGADRAEFKPANKSGRYELRSTIKHDPVTYPPNTVPIWYDRGIFQIVGIGW